MALLKYGSHAVNESSVPCVITSALEEQAAHYQKNGWAFVEGMFTPDFHKEIVRNWPKRRYLEPPRQLEKSYNTGFKWLYDKPPMFARSDPYGQYPTFTKILSYLRTDEFAERMKKFIGATTDLICYSFILTDSYSGSEVMPHKDGIYEDKRVKTFLNMIFFVDASGGKNSGGLILSRDNELKDVLIAPENLTNTCLIYDSMADMYHGFPPIEKGKFRWAFTVQFCEKSFVEKGKDSVM